MYTLHCTKKLLDRIKPLTIAPGDVSRTVLGNWYATALFWKPQLALLVNEQTLLPVLMPLAPATTLAERFLQYLSSVLVALEVNQKFIEHELTMMGAAQYAKTSNRSVVGIMNQFSYLAEGYREYLETDDLLTLSLKLAHVPCSPLYKREVSPDKELHRWIRGNWQTSSNDK